MAMKIPFVGLATAVLAVGAPVGSVVAQTQQQLDAQTLDWCESKGMVKEKDMEGAPDDVLADLIISGCTAVFSTEVSEAYLWTGVCFTPEAKVLKNVSRQHDHDCGDYPD